MRSLLLTLAICCATATAQAPVPALLSASMGPQLISSTPYQSLVFSFSDQAGRNDIGVANILVNSRLSPAQACFLAYVPVTGNLYLVNDTGTELLPPIHIGPVGAGGGLSNNQCAVDGSASYVENLSHSIVLHLRIRITAEQNGVFWLATRNLGDTLISGWLVSGIWIR